jgi:PAS domain S-box-containing protein
MKSTRPKRSDEKPQPKSRPRRIREKESALTENDELLRFALETSHTGAWDLDLVDQTAHRSFQHDMIFGYDHMLPKWTYGMFLEHVVPEDRGGVDRCFKEALKKRRDWSFECRIKRADGQIRWIWASGRHRLDSFGIPRRMTGIVQDITDRKRAEEALRDSEAHHRLLADTMLQGIVYQDASGKIIDMNPAAERILGKTAEEFLGSSSVGQDYHTIREDGSSFPGVEHPAMVALQTGQPSNGTVMGVYNPVLRAYRWISIDAMPLFLPGEKAPYKVYTVFEDITERKRAEESLQQLNANLERLVEERTKEAVNLAAQLRELASELTLAEQRERQRVAKVLHDHIQQMLVAAKLQTSALMNRQSSEDPTASAKLIYDLLDQTLAASRTLTAELSPPILQDGGLGPALQWLARSFLEKHELRVEIDFDASAEPRVEDVRIFLFDAVREILFNVVKHAGIKKAHLEGCRGEDGRIRITVSDAGHGFNPARLQTGQKWEGLGLFSIQQRLSHLGGSMEVRSSPHRGTQITLIAPQPPTDRQEQKAAGKTRQPAGMIAAIPKPGKIRVVLADDHHIIRQGLAGLLRMEPDIDVVGEASNGAQAINLARSLRPNVVVMDVSMPVVNGIEATMEIHRDFPEIKVIGLSMHEEAELSAEIHKAGAVAYVAKGGPPEALVEAIRKAINC